MTGKLPLAVLLVLLALILRPGSAGAHEVNLTNARLSIRGDDIAATIGIKGSDVDRAIGSAIYDAATGTVDGDALRDATEAILRYFTRNTSVGGEGGAACRQASAGASPDRDGIAVTLEWDCAGVAGELVYRSTVLTDIEPSARQIVLIENGSGNAGAAQILLNAGQPEAALSNATPNLGETVLRYIASGIEHIFLGYDHVAFLLAILLWARRLMPVVKIVTAFTAAHSITLSLAASGVAVLPPSLVEPAIAASIVYVAAENFISRDVDQRWRDTFVLGLIHGFGFAGALQAFGLPTGAVVPALASFNVGVEIGQLAIVAVAVPALLLLDRVMTASGKTGMRRPGVVYAGSLAIMSLGLYWLAERTLFVA
jgi:hydrogenase/urease accessory protein HupE